MKLAIMQPYFFPYIGYFQLVAAVDKFVFYDDVNYIKNGWINRNRLLISGGVQYFTIPLAGASPNQRIYEVKIQNVGPWREKMKRSIEQSYAKAPFVKEIMRLLEDVLNIQSDFLSDYAKASVKTVTEYVGIKTSFVDSSRIYPNQELTGVDRVLDIVTQEQASFYYNLPGGASLYDHKAFKARNVELCFIEPYLFSYAQRSKEFIPGLSMLDVLMFNDRHTTQNMLQASQRVLNT
jgi:hypothetical protein